MSHTYTGPSILYKTLYRGIFHKYEFVFPQTMTCISRIHLRSLQVPQALGVNVSFRHAECQTKPTLTAIERTHWSSAINIGPGAACLRHPASVSATQTAVTTGVIHLLRESPGLALPCR